MAWSDATGPWNVCRKSSDFINPGASGTFVFLDEREGSINDAFFVVDMDGYPTSPVQLVDSSANYHGGSGGLSFADGHSELKKWKSKFVLSNRSKARSDRTQRRTGATQTSPGCRSARRAGRIIEPGNGF